MPKSDAGTRLCWHVGTYIEGEEDEPMYYIDNVDGLTICDAYTIEDAMLIARMGTAWEPLLACLSETLALLDKHDVKTRQEIALRQHIDRALALAGIP